MLRIAKWVSGGMERRTGTAMGRTSDSSLKGRRGELRQLGADGDNSLWNEASYGLHHKQAGLSDVPCSAWCAYSFVELEGEGEGVGHV